MTHAPSDDPKSSGRRKARGADAGSAVLVNGERQPLPEPGTVAALVASLGLGTRKIAVAVNREVVARSRFGERVLSPGDRVEILEAVGGG